MSAYRVFAVALLIVITPAAAEGVKVKDTFKKTEQGFGELLKGMGQELKKVWSSAPKKDDKKPAKSADKKAE